MKTTAAICFCILAMSPQSGAQGMNAAASTYYASDFSSVEQGDFPPGLTFKGGGMQIDDSQGDALLRFKGGSWFHVPLPKTLPESFAIEFDYYTTENHAVLFVAPFDANVSGKRPPNYTLYRQGEFNYFALANTSVGVAIGSSSKSLPNANAQNSAFTAGVVPIRLEVRGTQAKVFVTGKQVVMHPAVTISRTDTVEFFYASMGSPGHGYIGNIRIEGL